MNPIPVTLIVFLVAKCRDAMEFMSDEKMELKNFDGLDYEEPVKPKPRKTHLHVIK